jgi:hypothetical protein
MFDFYDGSDKTLEEKRAMMRSKERERERREEERSNLEKARIMAKQTQECKAAYQAHNDALWAAWRADALPDDFY